MPRKRLCKEWYTLNHDFMESLLKRTLTGLAKLTRFNEYVYFVVISTLLGVASAQGTFHWRLLILLLANWLAVGFAFMINDIEDAPDDAFSTKNQQRNPVSSGLIAPKTAWIATIISGLISASLFALVGFWPFVFGVTNLILGLLFSVKTVQLKKIAFVDLLSHGLMLAGLPFLSGYAAHTSSLNRVWFWPFIFILSVSILIELRDDLKDVERERLDQEDHIKPQIGEQTANGLMIGLLILGAVTGVVTFFLINLIPAWVMVTMAFLVIVFVIPTLIKVRRGDEDGSLIQDSLKKHVERAVALALILHMFLPWLIQIFQSL